MDSQKNIRKIKQHMPKKEKISHLKKKISPLEKEKDNSATKQAISFGDRIFMCELKKVAVRGGKITEKVFCREIRKENHQN